MKVYVPNLNDYKCIVIRNNDIFRAYKQEPRLNSTIEYDDYYYNSNYYYTSGEQSFSQYSTIPSCISSNELTDEIYYRNDFDKILIIFLILCIFCFYLPLRLFTRLNRRSFK